MSAATTTGTVGTVSPTVEPPPIAVLLPLLRSALTGSTLLLRLGTRLLLVMVYPLRIIWSTVYALLSPIIIAFKVTLDIVLFTPFSIVRSIAVALYPVYVFCAIACIFGATIGIFGHYASTALMRLFARTKYFSPPPVSPSTDSSTSPHVTLRKRKRKSVRLQ